jgi:hypothetical protein
MAEFFLLARIKVMMVNDTLSNIGMANFIDGGIQGNPEKTTDLPEGSGKFYHILLYRVYLTINMILTHN